MVPATILTIPRGIYAMLMTMRPSIALFLVTGSLAIAGSAVRADQDREAGACGTAASTRGTPGPFHFEGLVLSPMQLLGTEPVQAELKLDETQKAKIQEALDAFRSEMSALNADISGLSREEVRKKFEDQPDKALGRRQKAAAITEEKARQAEEVLTPEQARRLKEVRYQLQGAAILNLPEVVDPLQLTDEQKQQLGAIQQDGVAARRAALAGLVEPRVAEERIAQIRKEAAGKTLAVLTDPQREQLAKLRGKPIAFDPSQLFAVKRTTERRR